MTLLSNDVTINLKVHWQGFDNVCCTQLRNWSH